MSIKRILATMQLKEVELEELEQEMKQELKKEFQFFTFEEVHEQLLKNPSQKLTVLSKWDYEHMGFFRRDGKVYPDYLMDAYLDRDENLGIGGFSNRDGYIGNDRCRDTTGLYVWKKQQ